jgi:hypothetical protein
MLREALFERKNLIPYFSDKTGQELNISQIMKPKTRYKGIQVRQHLPSYWVKMKAEWFICVKSKDNGMILNQDTLQYLILMT